MVINFHLPELQHDKIWRLNLYIKSRSSDMFRGFCVFGFWNYIFVAFHYVIVVGCYMNLTQEL